MSFEETSGCEPGEIEKLVEPLRQRIEECHGDKGGRLRVRLRGVDGKLTFQLEPGATLDPRERQCILDALATIPGDGLPGSGRGVPSSGFTSLMTIEW